jgi:hypothetical protein
MEWANGQVKEKRIVRRDKYGHIINGREVCRYVRIRAIGNK